ncbi:MAG TPA: DUF3619 family protein [Burkholderiaceae bacterium]|nr:DUF3619 family protein [Burkholderiaceae bacterium]
MNEVEFGYRIRQALNEGVQRMEYKTTFRLEKARKAALEKYRKTAPEVAWVRPLQTASGPQIEGDPAGAWRWLRRLGLVAPLVALILGFIGVHEWQRTRTMDETAAIDFAILLDEAPVEAYADKGFGVFLKTGEAP